jgi:AcrR family transcriptional regulator
MNATRALVGRRGTATLTMSEIAEQADVSRKAAYQQFGDRDTLILQTATDLIRRELLPALEALPRGRARVLAHAEHFAVHRGFYRPLLLGPGGLALSRELADLMRPITRQSLEATFEATLDAATIADLTTSYVGGSTALLITWITEGDDPLDPDAFTERFLRVQSLTLPPA